MGISSDGLALRKKQHFTLGYMRLENFVINDKLRTGGEQSCSRDTVQVTNSNVTGSGAGWTPAGDHPI